MNIQLQLDNITYTVLTVLQQNPLEKLRQSNGVPGWESQAQSSLSSRWIGQTTVTLEIVYLLFLFLNLLYLIIIPGVAPSLRPPSQSLLCHSSSPLLPPPPHQASPFPGAQVSTGLWTSSPTEAGQGRPLLYMPWGPWTISVSGSFRHPGYLRSSYGVILPLPSSVSLTHRGPQFQLSGWL